MAMNIRSLSVLGSISILLLASPVGYSAIQRYFCVSGLLKADVVRDAKRLYFDRLLEKRVVSLGLQEKIKCSSPVTEEDFFYGVKVGQEWKVMCAFIQGGLVQTAEAFNISRCGAARNWEFVDEGFPKPITDGGYSYLK
ncbi:hypothetical protein JVX98_31660 (plasmid) [Ensifer sp. PDNC004]|uniref:hypothetical protein n=1 Tax=Ensifer sp. PDNC004 TaxID=2811423 RepID=UPI0019626839|nr:hypothetical protein [Ensifer sp. PDNC004]QRY70595.1 hypothetical protein JVX98_31660 [Ensifer sp. PDNC004]